MNPGEWVEVELAGGKRQRRRVVAVEGDVVFVCRAETYDLARSMGREPAAVGFNRRWVKELPKDAA